MGNEGHQSTQVPRVNWGSHINIQEVGEAQTSISLQLQACLRDHPSLKLSISSLPLFLQVLHLIITLSINLRYLLLLYQPRLQPIDFCDHPFFQVSQSLSFELKSFCDQVLALEGDISEMCSILFS